MWYVGGSEWVNIKGKDLPVYEIKYIESMDGIKWPKSSKVCLTISNNNEHGFGRPYVIKHNNTNRLFYSIRDRTTMQYKLGFADEKNDNVWKRKDDQIGLNLKPNSWKSRSASYMSLLNVNHDIYCFYNGDDFGRTGIGFTKLIKW